MAYIRRGVLNVVFDSGSRDTLFFAYAEISVSDFTVGETQQKD